MTPEEARRLYEAMSPERRAQFEAFAASFTNLVRKADEVLTTAGRNFADKTEADLRELTERNGR